jgi:isoquinoline 1-oxidoreductase alpha subunit
MRIARAHVRVYCHCHLQAQRENGMAKISLMINGVRSEFDGDSTQPLLWFLRDGLRLTGTKYGCGVGQCGACTVHIDGRAARACTVTMANMAGRRVTTIEGLESNGNLHPVQEAWIAADVPQCGYCQAGQIMATVDLLKRIPRPKDTDLAQITNLCRCGTHVRIKAAIKDAAKRMSGTPITGGKS